MKQCKRPLYFAHLISRVNEYHLFLADIPTKKDKRAYLISIGCTMYEAMKITNKGDVTDECPLVYSIQGVVQRRFDSVVAASRYFGLGNNIYQYIGKTVKSKHFPVGYKLEYIYE